MAGEEMQVLTLREDFYRDSFGSVLIIISGICVAIILLAGISVYFYLSKPKPVNFVTMEDWRVLPLVPVEKPYLSTPDLLQWVAKYVPASFEVDFNNYSDELKSHQQYFTPDGWSVFSNQLNNYVDYTVMQQQKLFISAVPAGAPTVTNEGLLSGRYAWTVAIPIVINYTGIKQPAITNLKLEVVVVRVPTTDNLNGVAIDNVNVLVSSATENQKTGNLQPGNG